MSLVTSSKVYELNNGKSVVGTHVTICGLVG